jgi:hypothetical protein
MRCLFDIWLYEARLILVIKRGVDTMCGTRTNNECRMIGIAVRKVNVVAYPTSGNKLVVKGIFV